MKSIRKGAESVKAPLTRNEALDEGTNTTLGQAIVDVAVLGGNLVSTAGAGSTTRRLRPGPYSYKQRLQVRRGRRGR